MSASTSNVTNVNCNVGLGHVTSDATMAKSKQKRDTAERDRQQEILGEYFRLERERADIKQEVVAKHAGITRQHYIRIEKGTTGTTREVIKKIVEAIRADEEKAYGLAGIPTEHYQVPLAIRNFSKLPKRVQTDMAVQINALAEHYKNRKEDNRTLPKDQKSGSSIEEISKRKKPA